MKFKRLAVAVAIGLGGLLPGSARAVQWVPVAEAEDGSSKVYVDRDSIKRRGKTVQLWTYHVFRQRTEDGMDALKMLKEVNCTTGDYRVFREIIYIEGRVQSDTKYNTTYAATPGTLGEAVFEAVCRR